MKKKTDFTTDGFEVNDIAPSAVIPIISFFILFIFIV